MTTTFEDATEHVDDVAGGMIEPDDTLAYIAERLMQIEVAIYRGPTVISRCRQQQAVAEEKLDRAKARALLNAPTEKNGRKLTAPDREAHVFLETTAEREEFQVRTSAYEYAKDVNRALDREKDALQTRSANLRAQANLAGRSHA